VRGWFLNERQFQFEWDEIKAAANLRKHGVSFELASTVFSDPLLLTAADVEHSETEERWFSIGLAINGAILSIIYLWWNLIRRQQKPGSSQPAKRHRLRFGTTREVYE
jgi:uncharacterized DUF497 family protein